MAPQRSSGQLPEFTARADSIQHLMRGHPSILLSSADYMLTWGQRHSIWPAFFGLACCAIEMIMTAASRFDIARFGSEVFRASPRQADLLIGSGTVCKKMAPAEKRVYDQMADPKWVIAMGS